jgi:hypothetical protein
MRLVIDAQGSVALDELDDLRRFKLVLTCAEMSRSALAQSLHGLGWPAADADAAWIDPASLRRLARRDDSRDWQSEFDGMLGIARKHGWVDEKTGAVRVHIERPMP